MNVETKTNGYTAETLQDIIKVFETAAQKLFPDCRIKHFYYGNSLDMVDLIVGKHSADFNISKSRISLCGYECSHEEYEKFGLLTFNDELHKGKLFEI